MSNDLLPVPADSNNNNYALAPALPIDVEESPQSSFRVKRFIHFLLKYWWVMLITLVIGLGIGGVVVYFKPPTYISTGSLWRTDKIQVPGAAMFADDDEKFLGTQRALLQSVPMRDNTLEQLRHSTNSVPIPLGPGGDPIPVAIEVTGMKGANVFRLDATSANREFTRVYLRTLMQVYLDYKRNVRSKISNETLQSIANLVHKYEEELNDRQAELSAYEQTNNIAILTEEGTITGGRLSRLQIDLQDLELQRELLTAAAKERAATNNDGVWVASVISPGSTNINSAAPSDKQDAYRDIQVLRMQREQLSQYLKPKHPRIVKLDQDIQKAEKLIEVYRQQGSVQLASQLEAIDIKMTNTTQTIKVTEKQVVEVNARIAGAAQLKRKVDAAQNIYDRLKALVDSVSINRSIDQENLEILQNAGPAQRSYSKEAGLMAMSGLGGFAVGVLIIALITFRDDQFTSLNEISEKLGQSVLGQVPLIPNAERNAPLPLLEMNDQRHAYAESYRSLRSALHFLTVDGQKPRVILMTSAMPHEGKSTVSANLARTLALSGSKVILIDADLRRGMLNKLLGMQRAPGLSDLLSQPGITLEQVIQRDPVINFAFIASGKLISNSADILLGPAFDKLVATLREQYDYVLVDSSPVFATDDSTTLAPRVDGVLFVVRNRFSRMGPSKEALDLLYQRQARVLGVVYNQVDASARSYYYYKYDEYNYTAEET